MVHSEGNTHCHYGGTQYPEAGAEYITGLQCANATAQEVGTNSGAGNEGAAVGDTKQYHHRFGAGCHVDSQERKNNLRGGDGDNDEGGCPGFFPRIEYPQVQQHDTVGD